MTDGENIKERVVNYHPNKRYVQLNLPKERVYKPSIKMNRDTLTPVRTRFKSPNN